MVKENGEKLNSFSEIANSYLKETSDFVDYLRKKIKFSEECAMLSQSEEARNYYHFKEKALEDLMKQAIKYLSRQEYLQISFRGKLQAKLKSLEKILNDEELDEEEKHLALYEREKLENWCREFEDFKNKRSSFG